MANEGPDQTWNDLGVDCQHMPWKHFFAITCRRTVKPIAADKRSCIYWDTLTFTTLGIFSRWQIDDIFLIFPENKIWVLRRQFAWTAKSCFLEKIRKILQNVVCWKSSPSVLSVNSLQYLSWNLTSNGVFRENICPSVVNYQFFYCSDLEN